MPPSSPPFSRQGPRPAALHLSLALASAMSLPAALMLSKHGLLNLKGEAKRLQSQLAKLPHAELGQQLGSAATQQLDELTRGIQAYRQHPAHRILNDMPTIWREGSARVLDYGGTGPLVLFVPSLINRAYILDLDEKRSMMRGLVKKGLHPLLLDWGAPGRLERDFTLDDAVGRLVRALRYIGEPVHLAGYCMGGLIAMAAVPRYEVQSLTLMATPWDFHADRRDMADRTAQLWEQWQPIASKAGVLPVDAIQSLFVLADPMGPPRKFRQFAKLKPDSPAARNFVLLEDWINDGVSLPHKIAAECLDGFYGRNITATGEWLVNPKDIHVPTLVMVPTADYIVPPKSARPLGRLIPHAQRLDIPLGHVGMIVSREAPKLVWGPLAKWMKSID